MNYPSEYAPDNPFAIDAVREERATFIRRTYGHLIGAIAVFAGLLYVFCNTPAISTPLFNMMVGGQWWMILAAFIGVSWLAEWWAVRGVSLSTQYAGLILYTAAQAMIFVPIMLYVYEFLGRPEIVTQAALLTLITFGGLTAVVMFTGADFSFLRGILMFGGFAALGLIVVATVFGGLQLGIWFTFAMLALSAGSVLYSTSNVLHHYRTDQYVAAALSLFASVALMFWYMIRLVIALQSRD